MIDSVFPVELNGVKYRLAEDSEGEHYVLAGEPLRPPNSVVVQGTGRQDLFQVRPDVLLWSLTDWSGGEGQIKYDPSASNRHAFLHNVNPFTRPGSVYPGPAMRPTLDNAGTAPFDPGEVFLVRFGDRLTAWSKELAGVYWRWSEGTQRWSTPWTLSHPSGTYVVGGPPVNTCVTADNLAMYYLAQNPDFSNDLFRVYNNNLIYKMNAPGDDVTHGGGTTLRTLGGYVYAISPGAMKVWEIAANWTGTEATGTWALIDDGTAADAGSGGNANVDLTWTNQVAVSKNRIYYVHSNEGGETRIREVIPTTSAAAGSGAELAVIYGTIGNSLWYSNGLLYMSGRSIDREERVLFYIDPDTGTYGIVSKVLDNALDDDEGSPYYGRLTGNESGVGLGKSIFTMFDLESADEQAHIYQLNHTTGGVAQLTAIDNDVTMRADPPVLWQNELWQVVWPPPDVFDPPISTHPAVYHEVTGTFTNQYEVDNGVYVISPWHDFGLADNKILSSIVLTHDPLPSDAWALKLYYAKDGQEGSGKPGQLNPTWNLIGESSTRYTTSKKFTVSTDAETVLFSQLQLKVVWEYIGSLPYGSAPTTAPTLNGIEVRAQVSQPQRVWKLLLDLGDDFGNATHSHAGSVKYDNLSAAGQSGAVVSFKDGYPNRVPGVFTEYDVLVDEYVLSLDRPGEGFARVTLREVV